jgi:thioredoxin 1
MGECEIVTRDCQRRTRGYVVSNHTLEIAMAQNIHEVTDTNFSTTVSSSDKPFLVDFWATWCAPCRAIAPHVEALATEMSSKLAVGKLNIDDNPGIATQFGVRSIPTLILFAVPKAKLEEMIKRHLG